MLSRTLHFLHPTHILLRILDAYNSRPKKSGLNWDARVHTNKVVRVAYLLPSSKRKNTIELQCSVGLVVLDTDSIGRRSGRGACQCNAGDGAHREERLARSDVKL